MQSPDSSSRNLAWRVSGWLIRNRWLMLAAMLLLIGAALYPAGRLHYDRSISNMFAPHDPLLRPYRRLQRTFGGDDVVVVCYIDEQLLTRSGIERVAQLTANLEQVEGVKAVTSLTTTPAGKQITSPLAFTFLKMLQAIHIGTDNQTTALGCVLRPDLDSARQSATVERIHQVARQHDDQAVLVGGPVMIVEGFRLVERDGRRLGWLTTLLLGAVIIICFRSLRWMLIALAIVNVTLLITEWLLVFSNTRLSIVSSMLWSNVTVVGIATIIHVLVHFREERRQEATVQGALWRTGGVLAGPIMWTCLSDAAGFGALMAADVGPVRDFGFMMTWASLIALVCLAGLVPGLALIGKWDVDPHHAWGEARLRSLLQRLLHMVLHHPAAILCGTALAVILSAAGCWWLEVETDFTRNFRQRSSIVHAYSLVESRLGGAGVWDIILPAPPPEKLNAQYVARLRRFEQALRDKVVCRENERTTAGLTKVLGLVDALDTVPRPNVLEDLVLRMQFQLLKRQMPAVCDQIYAADPEDDGQYYTRIMLRSKERQSSDQKRRLIEQVNEVSRQHFPAEKGRPGAEVTGFFVLLTHLIDSVVQDQMLTLSIAVVAIAVMLTIAFRSVPLALIALIPNLLPIVAVLGIMGWTGLKINMGAVMIAAVTMGLSVDAEIHYLTAYRRYRRQGMSLLESLERVQLGTGRAIVFATLALVIGFGGLCASDFVPTIYFGGLVGLSILMGLAGNLVLLPLLCYVWESRFVKPQRDP